MGDASFTQDSFLGGEWSLLAQGRVTDQRYRTAMAVCFNGIPLEAGAWTRRPGTKLAAITRNGQQARVIPFDFEEQHPYTMELTNGYLRFFAGPALVMTNDKQVVSAISTANPAVVQTATAHGWSTGNQVYFEDLGVNDTLLQNRVCAITVTDSTHFSIADALTGAAIDGSTLGTFVSGNVARVMEIATPYVGTDFLTVRSVQAEKQSVILHAGYAPQVLSVVNDPTSTLAATFSLDAANFKDGPYLDPVGGGALITPDSTSGIVNCTVSFSAWLSTQTYGIGDFVTYSSNSYKSLVDQNLNVTPGTDGTKWEQVSPSIAVGPNGFLATDIGRMIRFNYEPSLWASGTSYVSGNTVTYGSAYWTAIAGSTGVPPGTDLTKWSINVNAANWTWGKIAGLLNLISGTLSGSTNIGTLTQNGGLSAAFDGVVEKASSAAAYFQNGGSITLGGTFSTTKYVGKNYTSASAQSVGFVTLVPSTDVGLVTQTCPAVCEIDVQYNLRAKSTAPSSSSDGTLLGQATRHTASNTNYFDTSALTIVSNDQTTAWNYVWVEIVISAQDIGSSQTVAIDQTISVAQMEVYSPAGNSGASIKVEILGPPLLGTSAIRTWRLGVYSQTTGWPSVGTYHEGRLWLAGAIGNRIDGSVPNDIFNFAPTEQDGTVTDASAIDYTFAAPDVNRIFWMTPDQQGIVCGTQAGEWLVQASTLNSPLTALNMQAHRVTRIGCANIEPRRTEHTIVFVQRYLRKVIEYFADVFSGKFTAPNLTEKAKHLTLNGIEQIAYQQELVPTIWFRDGAGALAGASYKRDTLMTSQGPTFIGWHRHAHGGGRTIESICDGTSEDGTLDTLTMVTFDSASGLRQVEVLTNVPDESTTLFNAWHVDSGIVPGMTQNVVIGGQSYFQIGGLWPLNGKTVSVYAGGIDCGDYVVSNGLVNVPYGAAGGLFTSAYVANYSGTLPIVVGFTFTSQGQIVRPVAPQETGARTGSALGKKRRAMKYAALLFQTQGIKFGTSFSATMRTANLKTSPDGGAALTPLQAKTGLHIQELDNDNGFDGMLCWQITRPYPATVVAVTEFLETQD